MKIDSVSSVNAKRFFFRTKRDNGSQRAHKGGDEIKFGNNPKQWYAKTDSIFELKLVHNQVNN